MGIGQRLKELRNKKKLTLKQVGEHLGMTATAISCYESEKRKPSHEVINKLAVLYETTTSNIMGMETENTNLNAILNSSNLHWDGIPLQEDELNIIKQILEMSIKQKKDRLDHRKAN